MFLSASHKASFIRVSFIPCILTCICFLQLWVCAPFAFLGEVGIKGKNVMLLSEGQTESRCNESHLLQTGMSFHRNFLLTWKPLQEPLLVSMTTTPVTSSYHLAHSLREMGHNVWWVCLCTCVAKEISERPQLTGALRDEGVVELILQSRNEAEIQEWAHRDLSLQCGWIWVSCHDLLLSMSQDPVVKHTESV